MGEIHYRFHDPTASAASTVSTRYDSDGETRLTFEELKTIMSDETVMSDKLLLLECSRSSTERDSPAVSPFLRVPRPYDDETMLSALETSDYGASYNRSSYYASAAMAAYCKASGEENTHTRGTPLPCGLNRVIITLRDEDMKTQRRGEDGRSAAAQIFWDFHYTFRMWLLLQGKLESDCVTFMTRDHDVCMLLRADLLVLRREYAKEVTLQNLMALKDTLTKKRDATVDWSKMKLLFVMGVTQCPSSGSLVWDPDSIPLDKKLLYEDLQKEFAEKHGPKSGQKRPRLE